MNYIHTLCIIANPVLSKFILFCIVTAVALTLTFSFGAEKGWFVARVLLTFKSRPSACIVVNARGCGVWTGVTTGARGCAS